MATRALRAPPEGKLLESAEDMALVEAQALLSWIHSQFGRGAYLVRWEDAPWSDRRAALKQAAKDLGYAA